MEKTELFFVDLHSRLGKLVDTALLINGSQSENMIALTAEDFIENRSGLFVTAGLGRDAPAVGYIACRNITETVPDSDLSALMPEKSVHEYAVIGGLYLVKSIRGRGIARQLVQRMTDKIFADFETVDGCAAHCNADSLPAFATYGYQPMSTRQQLFEPVPGKTPVLLPRNHVQ